MAVPSASKQSSGDAVGSAYIGIAAAGGLVFLIAPLQRLGDKFADRVVPPRARVTLVSPQEIAEAEAAYRDFARIVFVDHHMTREEELRLVELGDRLGLSGRRALEIRREFETDGARTSVPAVVDDPRA